MERKKGVATILKHDKDQIIQIMKNNMTLGGIGPRLMLMCLPYITLSLIFRHKNPEFLNVASLDTDFFKYVGFFLLTLGLIFWIGIRCNLFTSF